MESSKSTSKRGRPRKKNENEPTPSAVSTNKAITSITLSVDRSAAKDSSVNEPPLNSSTSKEPAAPLSSCSSVGDEDVDVDVVSERSADASHSPFEPIKSADHLVRFIVVRGSL